MLSKLRPRSVYEVLAAVAFFAVVAGGSAYAAAMVGANDIKNNAILSRHIKDGQVKNADLATNSVGSRNVIDGSLLSRDFKPGQLVADHYAMIDLPGGTADLSKTLLKKGPFTLKLDCRRFSSGAVGAILVLSAPEKFTYSQRGDWSAGGHQGATAEPISGVASAFIGETPQKTSFYWLGGVPITAISVSTSLDGVFSFGVKGYHDCEASFFGG